MTGRAFAGRQGLGLASMTQLGFVLVVTLVMVALGFRPFAGGPGDGPVSATSRDGDFELTIHTGRSKSTVQDGDFVLSLAATKDAFSSDENLDVTASLTYVGPAEATVIGDGPWGPLEFFMKAPGVTLHPAARSVCTAVDLDRGRTLSDDLLDLTDLPQPVRVPHGLYEIGVFATFRKGGCSGPSAYLRTTIVVAVVDGPDDVPIFTDVEGGATACMLMRNGGRLTITANGLGVADARGDVQDVVWPRGFSALRTSTGVLLLDRHGQTVAREGDNVVFDAVDHDGPLYPCGDDVHVEPVPSP